MRAWRVPLWLLGAGLWAASCNVYEGRTLELFPASLEQGLSCETERDCPKDKAWCARGECVMCRVDADCDPAHPACVGNQCVACRTAAECPASQDCNPVLNECAPRCTQPSDCAGLPTTQCSGELDLCVQCLEDAHCRAKDPACDRGGRCVECTSDVHCSGPRPFCRTELRRCAECSSDLDCGSGVCDGRDGKCVECTGDADCPGGSCDPGPRRCRVPCGAGRGCDAKHPVCDEAASMCVECLGDEHCMGQPGKPVCVTATQRCGECVADVQCAETMRCELETARCAPAPLPAPTPAPKDPMMMPPRP